jgi:hypothetical protein
MLVSGLVPLLLFPAVVRAAPGEEPASRVPAAGEEESLTSESQPEPEWSASASVYIYIVPESRTYAQPTVATDYRRVHIEARYNYEAFDTGSAWLGYNFGVGKTLSLEFTPMVGGVFGNTTGVAPGYELTLDYWKLELSSEGEYLFDTHNSSDSFAYTWSEFSLSPLEWLRFGLVAQRTRAYQTDVDIQRGLLVGVSYRWVSFTTYVFNLDQSRQTVVLGLNASF